MKILLVDDDAFIRELIRSILEPEGYDITDRAHVDAGIAALEAGSFDLVITDMVMPQKTGADFMQHIRQKKIPVPILAITGGVENAVDDYVKYADLFADAVLAKPFSHDEFVQTVARLAGEGKKKAAGK